MYTEILTALGAGKMTVALVDASDTPVCELMRVWMPEREKLSTGQWLATAEGVRASSAVLQRYMRVASPSRVLKFRTALEYTLDSLTMRGYVAFYPNVPLAWESTRSWNGFDAALDHLGIQRAV
jgi:hypothetical protein